MFPILAVGAVILGAASALVVTEATSGASSKGAGRTRRGDGRGSESPSQAALPQSYIVTPIGGDASQGRTLTAVEAVGKMIF